MTRKKLHELRKSFTFEAAHFLPHLPEGHKCRRLHGHSYRVTLFLRGEIDPHFGWFIDTGDIKKKCQPWLEKLDHHFLNEISGLENPTSEVLAEWIYHCAHAELPQLTCVSIAETCTTEASFPAH